MGIHKRNNSKYWYIQFVLDGTTHVKSSKTTNRRLAERIERQWRDELLEQTESPRVFRRPVCLSQAAMADSSSWR